MIQTIALRGIVLPKGGRHLRAPVLPPDRQPKDYLDRYDQTTLVYDAAQAPGGAGTVITCPTLFNLDPLLRKTLLAGKRFRHQRLRTSEHFFLREDIETLNAEVDGVPIELAVRPDLSQAFAGTNALLLMNKDNPLEWIETWAAFYGKAHGATAVVAFDNGSQSYTAQDLADRLGGVPGIEKVAVFQVPFRFGPKVKRYKRQSSKFLQNSMMNMARLTLLNRARAVLNVDPDEIILSKDDSSVFDAAVARRHRCIKIAGSWVYPAPGSVWPLSQDRHVYRQVPNNSCHDKWCAVPQGLMSRFGWDWHKVADEASRLISPDPRFEMLHCRATTTGWKRARNESSETGLVLDDALEQAFQRWFAEA